ncbi:tetratricopeptide repeat protein [Sphaerisporangium sp. NPDC088356]|uniref:tetratricopeptide repeat protein n=1 Tax=Sphaerisporangium sp. NPDC088356 TaxID=3154871 RepID=UPI003411FB0E
MFLERGDYAAASALLDDALAAFRRLGSKRGEALTLRSTALVHRASGDLRLAETLSARAVELLRETDDVLMEAYAVQSLAKTRIRLGEHDAVLPGLVDALGVCTGQADRFGEALILRTIGELHLARGDFAEAEERLTRSIAVWDDLGLPLFRARSLRDLASVRAARGDAAGARALREEALGVFAAFGTREYTELLSAL